MSNYQELSDYVYKNLKADGISKQTLNDTKELRVKIMSHVVDWIFDKTEGNKKGGG